MSSTKMVDQLNKPGMNRVRALIKAMSQQLSDEVQAAVIVVGQAILRELK